ncbi:ribose-phosphate pyrophosphokinase [bacterium]|nr:ribose-phosphate pyrophosphokinase [bacterium]
MNDSIANDRGKLTLLSCKAGEPFFKRVVDALKKMGITPNTPVVEEVKFANGEIKTVLHDYVRGNDVYIIQTFDNPKEGNNLHDNIMALLTAVDAARHSDAESVTAVIPQFPYSKNEKTSRREGIGARLIAAMLEESGAKRVLTMDIHQRAIQGFFNQSIMDNLYASREFMKYIKNSNPDYENLVFVAHDMGAAEVARFYANKFNVGMAIVRAYTKSSEIDEKIEFQVVGDVTGKDIIMVKDMISTGTTILKAVDILLERGAKSIKVITSFPFFNKNADEKFDKYYKDGKIIEVIGTDAVFHGEEFCKKYEWYKELSVAPLFAEVIYNINHKLSISELLDNKKEFEKI